MTVVIAGALSVSQPGALDTTRQPVAAVSAVEITAAIHLSTGVHTEEYFAEDYMVDNHDYAHTDYPV